MNGTSVALAIHRDSSIGFAPRALTAEREASGIARAFEEGAECALRAVAGTLGVAPAEFAYGHAPSYTVIRNFLTGECDVDERIAARVAFRVVEHRQRFRRLPQRFDEFDRPRERGWI